MQLERFLISSVSGKGCLQNIRHGLASMSPSRAEAEADNHRSPHPFPRLKARRQPTRMLRAGGQLTGRWGAHGEIHLFPWEGGREGPGEARDVTLMQWSCKCETSPAVSALPGTTSVRNGGEAQQSELEQVLSGNSD